MIYLFQRILDMAGNAALVILVVLLVRGLMRGFPRKYVYALWLIVGIRLVCPVAVHSPVSLYNLRFAERTYTVIREVVGDVREASEGREDVTRGSDPKDGRTDSGQVQMPEEGFGQDSALQQAIGQGTAGTGKVTSDRPSLWTEQKPGMAGANQENTDTDEANTDALNETDNTDHTGEMGTDAGAGRMAAQDGAMGKVLFCLSMVWLLGMVSLISWNVILTVRLRKRLRKAVLFRDNIYESDAISSPFVLGVFSPRIYIPFRLPDQERGYILKHEQYHIRRRDYMIKIIAFLITCVYWFHPLVWVSYFLMTRDMEMSCDEYVLSEMKEDVREAYSRSLLAFAANERRFSMGTLAFGETGTRNRIKHVLNYKKKGRWMGVPAILLFALVGTACLTDGQQGRNTDQEAVSTGEADGLTDAGDTKQGETEEYIYRNDKYFYSLSDSLNDLRLRDLDGNLVERIPVKKLLDIKGDIDSGVCYVNNKEIILETEFWRRDDNMTCLWCVPLDEEGIPDGSRAEQFYEYPDFMRDVLGGVYANEDYIIFLDEKEYYREYDRQEKKYLTVDGTEEKYMMAESEGLPFKITDYLEGDSILLKKKKELYVHQFGTEKVTPLSLDGVSLESGSLGRDLEACSTNGKIYYTRGTRTKIKSYGEQKQDIWCYDTQNGTNEKILPWEEIWATVVGGKDQSGIEISGLYGNDGNIYLFMETLFQSEEEEFQVMIWKFSPESGELTLEEGVTEYLRYLNEDIYTEDEIMMYDIYTTNIKEIVGGKYIIDFDYREYFYDMATGEKGKIKKSMPEYYYSQWVFNPDEFSY